MAPNYIVGGLMTGPELAGPRRKVGVPMVKVIVQHHVVDYDRWYPVYTDHERVRRQHGGTGHSITRDVADANNLVIVNDFATLEGARAFSQDPSLPAAMERGGVDAPPQVWIADEAEAKSY
jgi:hypothetical protein